MAAELPAAALKAIERGVPADRVLMPHIELTPKQRRFVQAMAEGASSRDAYLETYHKTGSSETVSSTASRIAANPKVRAGLEQLEAVQRLRYSQNPLQIRSFVVDSLQHEARTAQRPADRLRALELLGRLADVSAFETRSVVEHRSASDTKARLAEKLRRLTIDIEVTEAHAHAHAHTDAHEATPTPGEGAQVGGGLGGGARSNNPHESHESSEGVPLDSQLCHVAQLEDGEEAPLENNVGSHIGRKPIWQDPKRWYAETMGEVPKIEWAPREDARDEVQKRLRDDEGGS